MLCQISHPATAEQPAQDRRMYCRLVQVQGPGEEGAYRWRRSRRARGWR